MKQIGLLLAIGISATLFQVPPVRAAASDDREKQAVDLLRQKLDAATGKPAETVMAQANSRGSRPASYAEMEQLYLQGKISSRQYEKYMKENPVDPAKMAPPSAPLKTPPMATAPKPTTPPPSAVVVPKPAPTTVNPANPPTATPPPAVDPNAKVSEIEKKMDDIIKQKEARDKAAATAPAPEPKTKRDKLNLLLRQYIDGKVTEQEYNQKREKLLEEPGE
ncbi:MAG TPA: hypothetical protein VGE41_06295 [Verrucomicrobiae bacterium]